MNKMLTHEAGGKYMVTEIPQGEKVDIPDDYGFFVTQRLKRFVKVKAERYEWLYSGANPTGHAFYSSFGDVLSRKYTPEAARAAFDRVERAMEKDLTDSGLNAAEWQQDWQNLMTGNLADPPKFEQGYCSSGHQMKKRNNLYLICLCCGELRWN